MSKKSRLSRLFSPESVAVVGGGVWCRSVIEQLIKISYKGAIFPVHPFKEEILGNLPSRFRKMSVRFNSQLWIS